MALFCVLEVGPMQKALTVVTMVVAIGAVAAIGTDFWRDGKFDHCGIDSVNLLKTAEGWRIAAIVFTTETTGCKGR